jgi:uncharacterized membrane protein YeiB
MFQDVCPDDETSQPPPSSEAVGSLALTNYLRNELLETVGDSLI